MRTNCERNVLAEFCVLELDSEFGLAWPGLGWAGLGVEGCWALVSDANHSSLSI